MNGRKDYPLTVSLQEDNVMQGQGHPLGVDGAQDLGRRGPQQRLPVVQRVVSQLRWVLGSRHPLHLHHLSGKRGHVYRASCRDPAIPRGRSAGSLLPRPSGPPVDIRDTNLNVRPYHQTRKKPCSGGRWGEAGRRKYEHLDSTV